MLVAPFIVNAVASETARTYLVPRRDEGLTPTLTTLAVPT